MEFFPLEGHSRPDSLVIQNWG